MRVLASLAMKGPREAALLAAVTAAIPPIDALFLLSIIMGMISSAVIGLVILRMGWQRALPVTALAVGVAAMGSVYSQHPGVLLPVLLTAIMGFALRSLSLVRTMVVGLIPAVILVLLYNQMSPLWTDSHLQLLTEVFESWSAQTEVPVDIEALRPFLSYLALGVWASGMLLIALCALFLARHWQALLYNPGGFQQEFHALVLPKSVTLITVVLMFGLEFLGPPFGLLLPSLYVFSFIAGLALVHGLVGRSSAIVSKADEVLPSAQSSKEGRSLALLWLFYLSMVLLQPMLLLLISMAWMDSFAQFRRRLSGQ